VAPKTANSSKFAVQTTTAPTATRIMLDHMCYYPHRDGPYKAF
jgi:hypothetical protein